MMQQTQLPLSTRTTSPTHSVVPYVDSRVRQRFAVVTVHGTEEVGVRGTRLLLADDARSVLLDGYTGAIEGAEDSREGRVVVGLVGRVLGLSGSSCLVEGVCVETKGGGRSRRNSGSAVRNARSRIVTSSAAASDVHRAYTREQRRTARSSIRLCHPSSNSPTSDSMPKTSETRTTSLRASEDTLPAPTRKLQVAIHSSSVMSFSRQNACMCLMRLGMTCGGRESGGVERVEGKGVGDVSGGLVG